MLLPPPKRCGISFVIRVAEDVDPYGYAASYPPRRRNDAAYRSGKRILLQIRGRGGACSSRCRNGAAYRSLFGTPGGRPLRICGVISTSAAETMRRIVRYSGRPPTSRTASHVVPYGESANRIRCRATNDMPYRFNGSAEPPRVPRAASSPTGMRRHIHLRRRNDAASRSLFGTPGRSSPTDMRRFIGADGRFLGGILLQPSKLKFIPFQRFLKGFRETFAEKVSLTFLYRSPNVPP